MDAAEYTIVALNVALGFGFGWPLSRRFGQIMAMPVRQLRIFFLLTAVYALECVAFAASMGTYVLSVGLAFVWGISLGFWLRRSMLTRRVQMTSFLFALYCSLPAVSFLSVPVAAALRGWRVLSVEDGYRFGIPEFVPWPVNSILGFAVVVAVAGTICKVTITMGLVGMIARREDPGRPTPHQRANPRAT